MWPVLEVHPVRMLDNGGHEIDAEFSIEQEDAQLAIIL